MVISGWRCIWNQCWRLKKKGVKSIPKTTRVQHYIYIYTLHIFNGNQNTPAGKRIQSTPVCHPETWVQNFVYNGNQNSPTQEQIQFTSASHLSPDPLWANDHFQPENYEQMTTFNPRTDLCGQEDRLKRSWHQIYRSLWLSKAGSNPISYRCLVTVPFWKGRWKKPGP